MITNRQAKQLQRCRVIGNLKIEVASLRSQILALRLERAMHLITPFPSPQDAPDITINPADGESPTRGAKAQQRANTAKG